MDDVDMSLIQMLAINARTPYRELADSTGLSVAAVHKRIQGLLEEGVLGGFKLRINHFFKGGVHVMLYGTLGNLDRNECLRMAETDERICQFIIAGANKVYIAAILRGISGISTFEGDMIRELGLVDSTLLMDNNAARGVDMVRDMEFDKEFQANDARILKELQKDPRAPLSEVASNLGLTSKYVSRRLNRLIEQMWIGFTVQFNPHRCRNILSMIHIEMDKGSDKESLQQCLGRIPRENLIQVLTFSNVSEMTLILIWTEQVSEIITISGILGDCPGIKGTMPNIVYDYIETTTWVDEID